MIKLLDLSVEDRIAHIREQEATIKFKSFDNNMAWELGKQMVECAKERGYNLAIGIHIGEVQVFSYLSPTLVLRHANWLHRKSRMVMYAQRSSLGFKTEMIEDGKSLEDIGLDADYYGFSGGSFPITVEGEGVIGAVTASGLIAEEDHQFAVEMITEFLKKQQ